VGSGPGVGVAEEGGVTDSGLEERANLEATAREHVGEFGPHLGGGVDAVEGAVHRACDVWRAGRVVAHRVDDVGGVAHPATEQRHRTLRADRLVETHGVVAVAVDPPARQCDGGLVHVVFGVALVAAEGEQLHQLGGSRLCSTHR